MTKKQFALKTLKRLGDLAPTARLLACSNETRHVISAQFASEKEMDEFFRAMLECFRAAKELGETEETRQSDCNGKSVGPFSHDVGGGQRNIRGTKSLT